MVSPEDFALEFLRVAKSHQKQLDERLGKPGDYTQYMLGEVIPQVAALVGCRSRLRPGNLTLDVVFLRNRPPDNDYFYVALEHENVGDRAHEELVKLSRFNVPLKVLITYVTYDECRLSNILQAFGQHLKTMDYFNDFADKKRHLLLLGRRNPHAPLEAQSETHMADPPWTAYVWNGTQFVGTSEF